MTKSKQLLLLGLVGAVALTGCQGDASQPTAGVTVVATTSILGDVVSQIVGGDATVDVLMAPGVDPHDYSPSARDVELIDRADLVVANGLGLEEGLGDVLEAAASDGASVLEVGPQADPMPFHTDATEEEADHGAFDPHFWQDPVRMIAAVEAIAGMLQEIEPAVDWNARAEVYETELSNLDDEISDLLSPIPAGRRVLVTNHDAFEYFAARYDFEIAGVVIPGGSTLAEPSAADLADLVATLRALDVRAIFVENTASPKLAETVAAELGEQVTIAELYSGSLGSPDGPAGTYTGMLRTNAETIANASDAG